MSATQELIDVAREEVEAFNAGNWDRYRELHAPDAVYEELATHRRVEGVDAIVETNREWREAFPDAKGTITNAVACGDTVTVEITWEGTQSGPLPVPGGDIPPSSRRAEVKAVQILEISDHRIKENRHYFDMMGMLQQLGAM